MLQGARHAHMTALKEASINLGQPVNLIEIRTPSDLESAIISGLSGIILPGGESTTMRLSGNSAGNSLLPALFSWLRSNPDLPVLATCAGVILLADPQDGGVPLISTGVDRNAYGSQRESFQTTVSVRTSVSEPWCEFPGVFIRAPRFTLEEISQVDLDHNHPETGETSNGSTQIVARHGEEIVGVREANLIALTFHPELSKNTLFHSWLISAGTLYSVRDSLPSQKLAGVSK